MFKSSTLIAILILLSFSLFAQEKSVKVEKITQKSLTFDLENDANLQYGKTPSLELGLVKGNMLTGLDAATFYYVKAISNDQESDIKLFSTVSKSSGNITVYFNQWVDNDASDITNATRVTSFEDTIVAYIDRSQTTLDVCNYNTGSLPIVNAINAAQTRGVVVRYIAADNTGTNNDELGSLSGSIPMIQRPDDGEVMHNKFLIVDVDNSEIAIVLTGSVNHTSNSCEDDYNNMVIVEDQSLAFAYELEFEEMWGTSTNTPNPFNAKFGADKIDNTPHDFNIGGVPVELYFSPSDGTTSHIETAILSANTDMQFAMLTFINNDLGDAVIDIHDAGVEVKGIIENVLYFGSEYNGLVSAGIDVWTHQTEANMFHHKYGVIDANNTSSDPLVVTGSHNWTNSAEDDYDENTLIIHDAEIANMYYEEFMARYSEISGMIISDKEKENILVYPNLVRDEIKIEFSVQNKNNYTFQIIDLGGRLVEIGNITSSKTSINVQHLEPSVYFIRLISHRMEYKEFKFIKY